MTFGLIDMAQLLTLLSLVLLFIVMGLNHFREKPAKIMAKMIPPRLRLEGPLRPARLVAITGICEVLGGIGLAVPLTRPSAAVALMLLMVVVFPANAYASRHPEVFGSLAIPFWPRLASQLALIAALVWVGFGEAGPG